MRNDWRRNRGSAGKATDGDDRTVRGSGPRGENRACEMSFSVTLVSGPEEKRSLILTIGSNWTRGSPDGEAGLRRGFLGILSEEACGDVWRSVTVQLPK